MDTLLRHYEEEARAGRLVFQECPACGHRQAFARPFCSRCGSPDPLWRTAGGQGVALAHTVLHRAPTPDYRARLPYAIALVALDEGPRVMGHAAPGLSVGARVALSFALMGERPLLRFDPLLQEE